MKRSVGGRRVATESFISWIDMRGKQYNRKNALEDGASQRAVAYFRERLGVPVSQGELATAIGREKRSVHDVLVNLDTAGVGVMVYELDEEDKVRLGLKRRPAWYVAVTNEMLKA